VAWAQTALSEEFPSGWTYLQGVLFIVVVGFVPAGLAGLWPLVQGVLDNRFRRPAPAPAVVAAAAPEPATEKVESR
jgi:urea transport system permease protein